MVKDSTLSLQGAQVRPLVREVPHAAWCSKKKKKFLIITLKICIHFPVGKIYLKKKKSKKNAVFQKEPGRVSCLKGCLSRGKTSYECSGL